VACGPPAEPCWGLIAAILAIISIAVVVPKTLLPPPAPFKLVGPRVAPGAEVWAELGGTWLEASEPDCLVDDMLLGRGGALSFEGEPVGST